MNSITPTNLVSFKNGKIWLNTSLDEMMFGKTKSSLLLNDTGVIVCKSENSWKFDQWKFDETKFADEKVFFCGQLKCDSDSSVATLQDMIEKENPALSNLFSNLCSIYAQAIAENRFIPCNGATGIIYNSKTEEILFLPEKAFDKSLANFGKEVYSYYQDAWRDYVANGNAAVSFCLGVMAYFAVAKCLPFSEEKDLKISDRNFLPLEYAVNGINKKLAKAINSLLEGNVLKGGFPMELLNAELFEGESQKNAVSEEKFTAAVKAYNEKSCSVLHRMRFIRKNWPKALALAAVLVFATIATVSIIYENGKKPSVIGLDSTEVTEVFYKGLHTMDTDLMLAAAKDCPQAQPYISQVPQLYVTGQMRSAYNFESGISTPENWFFFEPDTTKSYSHYIYGITNFTIDGKDSVLKLKVPTRKNHPVRKLFAENGSGKIEQSPDAQHTVKYFLVHNQDNQIAVEQYTTVVTLKYVKNRWQILNLDQASSAEIISPLPVSLAYKKALSENNGEIIKSVDSIRKEFYWVPTAESLVSEGEKLDKKGY